jgi:hypothetical protein
VISKNLGCFVQGPTVITCGGAASGPVTGHVSALIRANGQIVILVQPTPHGIYPALYIDRAECNVNTSPCHLVMRT